MAAFDAEAIEVALFDLISKAIADLGIKSFVRNAVAFTAEPTANMPLGFLIPEGGPLTQNDYGLTKGTLRYTVLFWAEASPASDAVPQTILNNLLSALVAALTANGAEDKQTLGGLVENAFINGDTKMGPGITTTNLFLEVPIDAKLGVQE